jgi:acetyltransferase-like isoleucine patch superfamily enzyme
MIQYIFKLPWLVRGFFYKFLFQNVGWPSYIGSPLFLKGVSRVSLGKRVRLFPGFRIETHGKAGRIRIGNNVGIGQGFHCTAAGHLEIGDGTTILGFVFITDIDHDYAQVGLPVLEQPFIIRPTKIGGNCFIGFGACIQAGTILGDNCIVGAGSVLRGEYPPLSVIVGTPGRIVKQFDPDNRIWRRL